MQWIRTTEGYVNKEHVAFLGVSTNGDKWCVYGISGDGRNFVTHDCDTEAEAKNRMNQIINSDGIKV